MTPNLRLVGQRLKEYMQLRGLTITAVARMSRFSAKELAQMIDGQRYPVSRLLLLVSIFDDLNPEWLLHGTEPMLLKGVARPPRVYREEQEARDALRRQSAVPVAASISKDELRQRVEELSQLVASLNQHVAALRQAVIAQATQLDQLLAAQRGA